MLLILRSCSAVAATATSFLVIALRSKEGSCSLAHLETRPSLWRPVGSAHLVQVICRPKHSDITQLSLSSVELALLFKMGFGDFDSICEKAPLPLCSLVGPPSSISGSTGIIPNCYARNIELANTIIFEGASCFLHIIALGMTVIMILHIRSKFTAVGRLLYFVFVSRYYAFSF